MQLSVVCNYVQLVRLGCTTLISRSCSVATIAEIESKKSIDTGMDVLVSYIVLVFLVLSYFKTARKYSFR